MILLQGNQGDHYVNKGPESVQADTQTAYERGWKEDWYEEFLWCKVSVKRMNKNEMLSNYRGGIGEAFRGLAEKRRWLRGIEEDSFHNI